MESTIRDIAFGAWVGSFSAFLVLLAIGMADEARIALGLMCLFSGMHFGVRFYERLNEKGGDVDGRTRQPADYLKN